MIAPPNRRGLLATLLAAPIAAAAGGPSPEVALRQLRPQLGFGYFGGAAARLESIERALPLDREIPEALARLTARLESDAGAVRSQLAAEARAMAALALVYPPEVAAPRSFGAPLRRRLYADLLTRESERLAAAGEPPPIPPASPGPDA